MGDFDVHAKKRRRADREHVNSPSAYGGNTSASYLSLFGERRPIAVVVSPLKRRQGAILARNLRDAGAHVIEDLEDHVKIGRVLADTDLVVVTDQKSRAEDRVGAELSTFRSLQYVSTKWASTVLSTESHVPVDSYVLDRSSKRTKTEGQKTEQILKTTGLETPILPVWCNFKGTHNGDVHDKQEMLRRLPTYLCERSTITQCIFPCPNRDICFVLEQMAKKRVLERAGGSDGAADIRARAYRLASAALKCVPFALQTQQDVQTLHTFGPRVLSVVSEYLSTGQVDEVSKMESDARLKTLVKFREMYGVGASSARDLYDLRGIKSVEELRERVGSHPDEFSAPLVEYLRHYNRLGRVSLRDAVAFKEVVESVVNDAEKGSLHLRFVLCGGFRRGEQWGHDVDLLYCHRREQSGDCRSVVDEVVKRLCDCGLLVSVLSLARNTSGWEEKRYHAERSGSVYRYGHDVVHGLGEYVGKMFRVDIVGVRDGGEFPFATLAWSGSTAFQRDIRQYCEKKMWTFNQHGVFERGSGRRVEFEGGVRSEMDVFAALGLTYRAAFERSC